MCDDEIGLFRFNAFFLHTNTNSTEQRTYRGARVFEQRVEMRRCHTQSASSRQGFACCGSCIFFLGNQMPCTHGRASAATLRITRYTNIENNVRKHEWNGTTLIVLRTSNNRPAGRCRFFRLLARSLARLTTKRIDSHTYKNGSECRGFTVCIHNIGYYIHFDYCVYLVCFIVRLHSIRISNRTRKWILFRSLSLSLSLALAIRLPLLFGSKYAIITSSHCIHAIWHCTMPLTNTLGSTYTYTHSLCVYAASWIVRTMYEWSEQHENSLRKWTEREREKKQNE